MNIDRCVIVGSGNSIRNGDDITENKDLPLWNLIKNEFTLSANFNYKWFVPSVHMFSDYQFYTTQKENLDKLPLLVSFRNGFYEHKDTRHLKGDNLYLVKPSSVYYGKDSWEKGFYSSQLVGIFMITFAVALRCKQIFILGMDGCEINDRTHFYDKFDGTYIYNRHVYCGVGKDKREFYKTGNYNKINELNNVWYKPFELVKDVEIFNVSPESVIETFPKINYQEFYKILKENSQSINQDEIRQLIKDKINVYK